MTAQRRKDLLLEILSWIVIVFMLFWVLFPFYWAFVNSIKHSADTFRTGAWIPFLDFKPTLETWRENLAVREIRQRAAQQYDYLDWGRDPLSHAGHPGRLCSGAIPLQVGAQWHHNHMVPQSAYPASCCRGNAVLSNHDHASLARHRLVARAPQRHIHASLSRHHHEPDVPRDSH